jgi:hypothetical protein
MAKKKEKEKKKEKKCNIIEKFTYNIEDEKTYFLIGFEDFISFQECF